MTSHRIAWTGQMRFDHPGRFSWVYAQRNSNMQLSTIAEESEQIKVNTITSNSKFLSRFFTSVANWTRCSYHSSEKGSGWMIAGSRTHRNGKMQVVRLARR